MELLQEKLLTLLKEIDYVCKKHEIPYFVSGGSVIGAIRHKGFIPWDDDIDILMESKYWDKFYRVMQKEMPENRIVGCLDNNEHFPNMVYRYCDTSTTEIHKNELFGESTAGVVIDILLMDSLPNDEYAYEEYMKDLILFSELINVYYNYGLRFNMTVPYKSYLIRSKLWGYGKTLKKIEKRLKKYENKECENYIVRWGGGPTVFPKKIFGEGKIVEFEGFPVRIPEKAAEFLSAFYGDEWVEVPIPEKQNAHNVITDYELGYEAYFKEYLPRINCKRAKRDYEKLKIHYQTYKESQNKDTKEAWILEGMKEKYLLEKKLEKYKQDTVQMLREGRLDELKSIFASYMSRQGSSDFVGTEIWEGLTRRHDPIYIDIGDDRLSTALWLWIMQGRMSKAFKVLRARKMVNGNELSYELGNVEDYILKAKQAISTYEVGDYVSSLKLVNELLEKEDRVANIWKLKIRLMRKLDQTDVAQEARWICNALILSPGDGELQKYWADQVYERKGIAFSCVLYWKAYQNTRQGIIWLEIGELLKKELPWAVKKIEKLIRRGNYDRAQLLVNIWKEFIPDNLDIVYYEFLCAFFNAQTEVEKEDVTMRLQEYIVSGAEDRFKHLLWSFWESCGKNPLYLEAEIRYASTGSVNELLQLANELCVEGDSGDAQLLELLAKIYRKAGYTKKEFEIYHQLMAKGTSFSFVEEVIKQDIKRMLLAIRESKTEEERALLLREWHIKYSSGEKLVGYLVRLNMIPSDLAEETKIWLQEDWSDVKESQAILDNLYRMFIEAERENDEEDDKEEELDELNSEA